MVHRAQDTRLLIALAKAEKEYTACLTALLNASQVSFAALTTYGASCPPGQAQTVINVVGALNGAEDALKKYAGVVDSWRADLSLLKKSEDEVAGIFRDREILIGRVVKASSKRTSRDSVLGMALPSSSSAVQDPHASVATLGNGTAPGAGGSVKLGLAQAELQACEAHLALKEQELEKTRVRAVIGGLRRRCTALVECGWMWGEKGKEALRALETSSHSVNDDERGPNGIAKHRRYAMMHLISADNGSQLSVTPSQSASQILPLGSDSSAEPSHRLLFDEPKGSFAIDIPAAHSIDDHDAVHHNIPSSRLIVEGAGHKVDSSDSDEAVKLEAHKNKPFAHPRSTSERQKRHTLTILPSDTATIRTVSTLRPSSANGPNIRLHKQKPASDIGPGLVAFTPGEPAGTPYGRAQTTSGSLLGTITGLFKGKRASTGYDGYTGPTAAPLANGWQTRTNRNLGRSRRQLSSSEEDLPSNVKRRSRPFGEEEGQRPKKSSTTPSLPPKSPERSPDKGKARASPAVPGPSSAAGYAPRLTHERSSSSMRSRQTAANTALNARTNGGGHFHNGEHPPVGRSDSLMSSTGSGIVSGRRRDPQADNALSMGEVTRQSGGSRSNAPNGGGGGGGGLVLSSARLEVVRAPPSVTQAPVLLGPSPSPLVLPSARKASSGPGSRGAPSPPPRQGTGNTGISFTPAPTSPRGVAFYPPSVNGDPPRPLKSALRNSGLSPTPSPAPAIHGSVSASTPSSSGTPTMPTSARLPEIHAPIPRPPPPTSMPSVALPRPNRLSDIPASNRTSIISENEYDTCVEEFVDAEEGTESDTPPAAPTPPLPAAERPRDPPRAGELPSSLPPQRTLANGSPPLNASVSSTSTRRGKSVRMIIHPTVTVSAPEEDAEPPTPPAYDKHEWYKLTAKKQSHSRSTSGSGTSHRSEMSRSAMPLAWETRIEHHRSVWDNSEPEDEDYRSAKSALQRASAP